MKVCDLGHIDARHGFTLWAWAMFYTQTKLRYQWIKEELTRFGQKITGLFQRTK
jgi:hypothetical protein